VGRCERDEAYLSGKVQTAGLPYFNPHSFRKTLAAPGETLCTATEEFKAWSQTLRMKAF